MEAVSLEQEPTHQLRLRSLWVPGPDSSQPEVSDSLAEIKRYAQTAFRTKPEVGLLLQTSGRGRGVHGFDSHRQG